MHPLPPHNLTQKIFFILILLFAHFLPAQDANPESGQSYGVFIGAEKEKLLRASQEKFSTIVIEGEGFSKEDFAKLREKAEKIFVYVSAGSLENWRDFYADFSHLVLGEYENWEGEFWLDVGDPSWQDFVVERAKAFCELGADGIFFDNFDVYYHFENERIYGGLLKILEQMYNLAIPVVINGGDVFVQRLMTEGKSFLVYAVNQESVFTRITSYKNGGKFAAQKKTENQYFMEYLKAAQSAGIKIFLLEYTKDKKLKQKISDECLQNQFEFYISPSLLLE